MTAQKTKKTAVKKAEKKVDARAGKFIWQADDLKVVNGMTSEKKSNGEIADKLGVHIWRVERLKLIRKFMPHVDPAKLGSKGHMTLREAVLKARRLRAEAKGEAKTKATPKVKPKSKSTKPAKK